MRIIDAHTGLDVRVGDVVPGGAAGKNWKLVAVRDRSLFDVYACIQRAGQLSWVQLQVRVMHPKYLFQRVAFVPT